jgi:CRISPR/Cas system-associated exonuclease Cas4 (RecB family)
MKYDDKIYLIDWKSNKEIISDEDLNDNIQLSMYYWASRELGHEVDEIGLYFLRHLEYKTTTRTNDSTLDLFKNALVIEKAFEQEDLTANYSKENCKWCGFKDECDAWKNKSPMKFNKINKNFM